MKAKVEALFVHTSVKVALHERLSGTMEGRSNEFVHASALCREGYCPREQVLLDITGRRPRAEPMSTSQNFTFAIGRAVQDILVYHLEDLLWGDWFCKDCGYIERHADRPVKCLEEVRPGVICGGVRFIYKEPRFKSPVTGVSCGVDFVVRFLGHNLMRAVECKTIEKDGFKALKGPVGDHRARTSLYLQIIEEQGYGGQIDTDTATLLYADKGYGCKDDGTLKQYRMYERVSPFKEYLVKRDAGENAKYAAPAKLVKGFRDTGKVPQGVCPTIMSSRAKGCPVKAVCFSGKYPPGSTHGSQ